MARRRRSRVHRRSVDAEHAYREGSGPGWFDEVAAGRTVCTSMAEETDPHKRASMQRWGIISIAVVPIHVQGSWWGYVAYDDVETPRPWTAGELDALRTAAGLMAAAIERRRDRLQRHAAAEKYRALVEQVPSVVYAEYLDGPEGDEMGESYMSPRVTSLFGYSPQEWLDVRTFWNDIVHPEDFARLRALADRSLEQGDPWHVEYRIRRGRTGPLGPRRSHDARRPVGGTVRVAGGRDRHHRSQERGGGPP
ncbi:MAG: PAS domain-containing protein [Actinomycetota bacterium]